MLVNHVPAVLYPQPYVDVGSNITIINITEGELMQVGMQEIRGLLHIHYFFSILIIPSHFVFELTFLFNHQTTCTDSEIWKQIWNYFISNKEKHFKLKKFKVQGTKYMQS